MNNLEFALEMKNNVLQAVFHKENLHVLHMYQDIV